MGFWTVDGMVIDGSEKNSFVNRITIVPDGTRAPAMIEAFTLEQPDNIPPFYQITWKLVDGEYKGLNVRQKIHCFDSDGFDSNAKKRARALNMFQRLYILCALKPLHGDSPTNNDLLPFIRKSLGIVVREWAQPKRDGSGMSEGNWVSEVHGLEGFVTESGIKQVHEQIVQHAFDAFTQKFNPAELTDDIPF